MSTNPKSKPSPPAPTRPSWPVAALLLVGGVVGFYLLGQQDLWLRVRRAAGAAGRRRWRCSSPPSRASSCIAFGRESVERGQEGRLADAQGSRCR
ncbi:MAG: hypothetical protein MZW92_66990 [Comamonadaceae bacterium]|nr:hypothetical protein [Comamonadaceae bacterium]